MRKIVIVTTMKYPHAGGASTHITELMRALAKRGYEVRVVAPIETLTTLKTKIVARLQVLVGEKPAWDLLGCVRNIALQCDTTGAAPFLVHCHDPAATLAARIAFGMIAPIVTTVHGPLACEYLSTTTVPSASEVNKRWGAEKTAYSVSDWIIGVDRGQADHARGIGGHDRISTILNAVDVDAITALARKAETNCPLAKYVIVPRRLVPKNGVEVAISAFAKSYLPERGVGLLIVGDGPERARLEQLREREPDNIRRRIVFVGSKLRDETLALMSRAEAVVVPSIPHNGVVEASSLSLIEALSLGKATIASNLGGMKDLVGHSGAAILCGPGSVDGLRNELNRVVLDLDLRENLGRLGRGHAIRTCGLDTWIDSHECVYARARQHWGTTVSSTRHAHVSSRAPTLGSCPS